MTTKRQATKGRGAEGQGQARQISPVLVFFLTDMKSKSAYQAKLQEQT